jgi:hypothetical protein
MTHSSAGAPGEPGTTWTRPAGLTTARKARAPAKYGLRLLSRVLDEVRGEIDAWEIAELSANP